jgi:hypothetical protein
MKNCLGCKYADWKRTKSGHLHPSGGGSCRYPVKLPKLPASMCWPLNLEPLICGGNISRRAELKESCVYFTR